MNKYMVTLYIRTIVIIKTGPGNLQKKRINNNGNRIIITKSTDNDCVHSKKKLTDCWINCTSRLLNQFKIYFTLNK